MGVSRLDAVAPLQHASPGAGVFLARDNRGFYRFGLIVYLPGRENRIPETDKRVYRFDPGTAAAQYCQRFHRRKLRNGVGVDEPGRFFVLFKKHSLVRSRLLVADPCRFEASCRRCPGLRRFGHETISGIRVACSYMQFFHHRP